MERIGIEKCRVCGSYNLERLFSLGDLHISTFIDRPGDSIGKAPLTLVWCNNCTLVQLEHTAPQELMYSGHYWYRSGLNQVIINDLKEITEVGRDMADLKSGDMVLDIGANDGTLLSFYPKEVIRVGCEPAKNLIEGMKKNSEIVIPDFWNYDKYKHLFENQKAKIITAIGMFYDMDDPNQFIRDAVKALDENGIFIAQLMTSKPMLEKNDVGNICHEHIEYYSYESLKYLFEKNGLEIFKVEENSINGGSYRLFARHYKTGSIDYQENITKKSYLDLADRIEKNKQECVEFIRKIVSEGKKVYGYGASTKGNTILQDYGLDGRLITGIAEISEEKFGKYTVGSNIPIISEEEAKRNADYFLVLPYAFRESFIKREHEWIQSGGKFIFVTPKLEVYAKGSEYNKSGENKKKALIFGITGQDGSYLAEVLLEKGYEVHGVLRKSATGNTKNIDHIMDKIKVHRGDLADSSSIYRIMEEVMPEEIYNEADQDHIGWSYDSPEYSHNITSGGVVRIIEAINKINPKIKFFQPLTSNMFGEVENESIPQNEDTKLNPNSPYACAKASAYHWVKYYRRRGLFISTAIFYNHESPRRTDSYVTRKITKAVAKIHKGEQNKLYLGDISAKIDWGYSKEYMEAAWSIMQLDKPDDFIIATGESHSVKEFLEESFKCVGININWKGEGLNEIGYDKNTGREYVGFDPRFFRPTRTSTLIGDIRKAKGAFGFNPKFKFKEIAQLMVEKDLKD
ncbi:MAG: GDP-mannose 4,6-dehydratase [archaeon]